MSSSDSESGSSSSSSSEDERSKKKRSAPDVGASSKVTKKEKSHKEAKKQRKSSPETDSSDENDKKGKKETKDSSKNLSVDLGRNRLVTLSEFRGRISVDIREYYEKDGKQLPGKKGISLTPDEWNKLKKNVGSIDAALGKKA